MPLNYAYNSLVLIQNPLYMVACEYSKLFIQTYHIVSDEYMQFIPDSYLNKYRSSKSHTPRWETTRERN
jgi:hypothetical protein